MPFHSQNSTHPFNGAGPVYSGPVLFLKGGGDAGESPAKLLGVVGAKLAVYLLGEHGMELGCDIRWHCVVFSVVKELVGPVCGCCKGSPKQR